jgi:DNA repair ATPase RecN
MQAEGFAGALHVARRAAAHRVQQLVSPLLPEVGMAGAALQVQVEDGGILTSHGVDKV